MATVTPASGGEVDTEAVGEGDMRRAYGGLDDRLTSSLGVEGFEFDIFLLLDGVENLLVSDSPKDERRLGDRRARRAKVRRSSAA